MADFIAWAPIVAMRLCASLVCACSFATSCLAQSELWEKCSPGPWGELEYKWVLLAPPQVAIDTLEFRTEATEWYFPGATREEVRDLFERVKLRAAVWPELDSTKWAQRDGHVVVAPTPGFLEAMSRRQRNEIYAVLAKSERNPAYRRPFAVVARHRETAWLNACRLSPKTRSLVARFLYDRKGVVSLSNVSHVLSSIDDDERPVFLRWVLSTPTVTVRVRLTSASNLASMAGYWGSRVSGPSYILPLLESSLMDEKVAYVDIINLLPSFPRERLNRYPTGALSNRGGERPDCFWSAVNFLSDIPKSTPFDEGFAAYFRTHYRPVEKPEFGDVVLWADEQNRVPHAAVYIAGEIVFTKNGAEQRRPWVMSTIGDVDARYPGKHRFMRRLESRPPKPSFSIRGGAWLALR